MENGQQGNVNYECTHRETERNLLQSKGLYNREFEKDACGMGFVVNVKGEKSHKIIDDALLVLEKLVHRGAQGADQSSGDGAGIIVQIPHELFRRDLELRGIALPAEGEYGVAMIFAHPYENLRHQQQQMLEEIVEANGLSVIGWREVPIDAKHMGEQAAKLRPWLIQLFIGKTDKLMKRMDFERKLYVIRKEAERTIVPISHKQSGDFYIASLSSKTIVYKGMLTPKQIKEFYLDLADLDFVSSIAMVHSRFSTNTFPSWSRAHPNRFLVHNGEINTIRGNVNWINAREGRAESKYFPDITKVFPVVDPSGSDSARFDNTLEFLYMTGRSLPHAMMMMIPEPWENNKLMSKEKRDFYEFNSFMMEPWDGPAAMGFTDGEVVGGVLDRNGLRPARYYVTKDNRVIMASEAGVLAEDEENISYKGRLEPGKMLLIDTVEKRIISDEEIKHKVATEHPYGEWIKNHIVHMDEVTPVSEDKLPKIDNILQQQVAFGYTDEDFVKLIIPMAKEGKDPIGSMGADAPLAILSDKSQVLFAYFKQLFAQVTNPPIDAIREKNVTSMTVTLGERGNMINPDEGQKHALALPNPILTNKVFAAIQNMACKRLRTYTVSILFDNNGDLGAMEERLKQVCEEAEQAARDGYNVIVLSDRGISAEKAPIPSLLASSAVHQHLTAKNVRPHVGLVLESGEPREVHHFAALIGYGISAINPYLVFDSLKEIAAKGHLGDTTYEEAEAKYIKAVVGGVLKVMSKIGISTVSSYHGAQIFEALGLSEDFINKYFPNTASRIGGIGIKGVARETLLRHNKAFVEKVEKRDVGGYFGLTKNGEEHLYNPKSIGLLQDACQENDYEKYKEYAKDMTSNYRVLLRNLLNFKYAEGASIPIEEVEPVESIVKRFKGSAMSYGAISKEAHETLAIAFNRLGSISNSGEGGEMESRYKLLENGDDPCSWGKQIASGRFGVTANYVLHAKELQIKCAQGAKPGEGGQLVAKKVNPNIATARHSIPGVELVSPPPHHDIYSIEDLAELIYDLKNANRHARISVKLCSEAGVGTIAAGVAKAKADNILITGYDGGTGAAGLTSIKNTGVPWELGLTETHQTLLLNRLRDRVVLEVDSKLMTGFDVAVAALMGAEMFHFGTLPLIAVGCRMLRVCHRNTCAFGVATQDEKLRKRFKGKPEYVENLMKFIAQELREIMARLGFRTVEEMVGRVDCLEQKVDDEHWKISKVNLDRLLFKPYTAPEVGHTHKQEQDHELDDTLDMSKLLRMCRPALENGQPVHVKLPITNINRVVGTIVGSEVTKVYGEHGLAEDTIKLDFCGSAGQSVGSFLPQGITISIEGDANDSVGKSLSGGKIIVYPSKKASIVAKDNVIIGNVGLYGATSGEAYISGVAGERFCVRNSGAIAVVEGIGEHGCEYMTGGEVVILGSIGRNFGAGMSGGYAYILDCDDRYINFDQVTLEKLSEQDYDRVRHLIEKHVIYTHSKLGYHILKNWNLFKDRFTKVVPIAFAEMQKLIADELAKGLELEEAKQAAFLSKYAK